MRSPTRRQLLLALLMLPFARTSAEPQIVFLSTELQPLRLEACDHRYEVKA